MPYDYFKYTHTKDKWEKIGLRRRAGVAVPLFSLYSNNSIGIGEIPDLRLLVDWCCKTGMSIIQLLPLNDVGSDFAPYNSVSSFALDPMYLSLKNLKNANTNDFGDSIAGLRKKYRAKFGKVNYKIKKAKCELLWEIYKSIRTDNIDEFKNYIEQNRYWLKDYALYKVISESIPIASWDQWNHSIKYRQFEALNEIEINNYERIIFYSWLQWQLYEQMKDVKKYANQRGVLLMGDLPFLVSRESAEVWSHQNYFRLELSSGAPPDMYFATGQKWGMPPYNWDEIAKDDFVYIKEKLSYAENFYDMYRIDHFVGLFRVWTIPVNGTKDAISGSYLPAEEYLWEAHGRKIIDVMVNSTSMLPCAEDLGTLPHCSNNVLYEYGITGIDFQRYCKGNFHFKHQLEYRINSTAVLSTHDSSFFVNWWQFEAGTIDEKLFELMCESTNMDYRHYKYSKSVLFDKNLSKNGRLYWNENILTHEIMLGILRPAQDKANDFIYLYLDSFDEKKKFMSYLEEPQESSNISPAFMYKCLEKINQSASIFSIQLIHEYLCLDEKLLEKMGKWSCRINFPGRVSKNNWSLILPVPLEELLRLDINSAINEIILKTERI
ncbi:MAG: 4-alpha-glucanotransferase [Chlorobi bacterium]|nr:4-alpha-glucanotransferase [Chlorobiota bacterium]MCI0715315.1 4-alpha-glucanotransferase [Chlorobiota bacterium]